MTDDEFKLFKIKVARKHASYVRIRKEFQELVAQCTHNETHHKKEHDKNTNIDKIYDECVICGKRFNEKEMPHTAHPTHVHTV